MTESKIEATCKVKDGKAGWVDGKEEVLDQKKIDTTYKEECLKCKDFPDKEGKFKWNCTLQVFTQLFQQSYYLNNVNRQMA